MSDPMNRPSISRAAPTPEPGSLEALAVEQARERAIRVLSDGYAYDALTEDEFEWRLGQLSLANSPAEVQALIADLPTAGANPLTATYTGGMYADVPAPPGERIRGIMSEVRREGPWRLPMRLEVKAVMSNVRLDLRRAVIPPGCLIEVRATMSDVQIVVPPGLPVEFDVSPIMGVARNDSTRYPVAAGAPTVRVTGRALMAEVRVRVREMRY
ncbi:MAG TPA: DUF1707 domain-containing protein [Gemmatimonadaceae bacterium]|nr:DUF1707 domain-containing protein [Gemmatimonadaceae bacterium]